MAKRLTIHVADSPRDTWLGVDVGDRHERVAGVAAVQVTLVEGEPYGVVLTFARTGIQVVDERSSADAEDDS